MGLHAIRHTFATLLYECGVELAIIQQLLGHDSLISTEIYVHPHYVRNSKIRIAENEELFNKIQKIIEIR
jgi:site-specific recombinase XerD